MTHFNVCDNCKMSIFIQYSYVKERVFGILQMLRIHTGLRKWNKKNLYDKHLREINPIGIDIPCIKIAKSELLFEKYRMDIKRDKDAIEIQKDDEIKSNRFFYFMLRIFNHLTQLYVNEISLLIDTILKYQSRDDIAKEVEKPNRDNKTRNVNKEDTSKPSPKTFVL